MQDSLPAANILVLDGEQRAALAVTRSLLGRGHRVVVASHRAAALAAWSRGASRLRLRADPLLQPREFAREVADAARRLGLEIVLPVTDGSVQALLEHADLLEGLNVPIGSAAQHARGSDKIALHGLAVPLGLGIEGSVVIERYGDPVPRAARFPGVLKPHRSVVGSGSDRRRVGVRIVENADAARVLLDSLPASAFPVLVQPRVQGVGCGVFALRWNGRVLAWFAHRRLREKPPAGGVSTYSESMSLAPALREASEALLAALDWQGVAMLEFKQDSATGGWHIMELNGRFWGSLQLAIDAGVDFPALLVDAARGHAQPVMAPWRVGTRLRWEWGDLDHLLLRLIRSRERLQLPADAPSRLGALSRFLTHRLGRDRLEVLRVNDPLPFLVESLTRLVGR